MSQCPLLLDRYFFVKTALEAQVKGDLEAINTIETKTEVSKAEGKPGEYLVSLTVRLVPTEDNTPCYLGEFVAVGFFQVHPDYPRDKCDRLAAVNGAAILYAAVREMVSNLSARGPWPMLTLAAMNFTQTSEPKSRKSEETEEQIKVESVE